MRRSRRSTIRAAPSRSSCPTRPAGRPTRSRARWRRTRRQARSRISSSKTSAAAAPPSPPAASRTPRRTATRCCSTICRSRPTSRSTRTLPFDTEKDLTPIIFINNNPLVLVGRKTLDANTLPELLALMKKQPLKAASRRRLHRPSRHLAAGAGGRGRDRPTSPIAARRRRCRTSRRPCRPVLRHAAVGGAAGQRRTDEGLRHHLEGKVAAVPERRKLREALGPKLEILYLARPVRAGRNAGAGHRQAQRRVAGDRGRPGHRQDLGGRPASSPYPKDQRTPAAARAILKSEIARWGQVVRDNNIRGRVTIRVDGPSQQREHLLAVPLYSPAKGRSRPSSTGYGRDQAETAARIEGEVTFPAAAPARASPTYRPSRCSGCRSGSGGSRPPRG